MISTSREIPWHQKSTQNDGNIVSFNDNLFSIERPYRKRKCLKTKIKKYIENQKFN